MILVTGAAGFIGRYLVARLAADGYEVLAAANERRPSEGSIAHVALDLTRPEGLRALPGSISAVVHLAAATDVSNTPEAAAQCLAVNGGGTLALLEFCRERGIRNFVYTSSILVYGEVRSPIPITEAYPTRPTTFYGASKLLAEHYIWVYSQTFGLRGVILRLASVYGPGQHPGTVLAIFVRRALAGEPLEVFGSGTKVQDFVYIEDVVEAIRLALRGTASGVYHVGSGEGTNVVDLAKQVSEIFSGGRALVVRRPDLPGEETTLCLDISKARRDLGYRPRSLAEGLLAYRRALAGGGSR